MIDEVIAKAKSSIGIFPWDSFGGTRAGLFNPAAYITFQNLATRFYEVVRELEPLPTDEKAFLLAFYNVQDAYEKRSLDIESALSSGSETLVSPVSFVGENIRALYFLAAGELAPFVDLVSSATVVPTYELTATREEVASGAYLDQAATDWARAWLVMRALVEFHDMGLTRPIRRTIQRDTVQAGLAPGAIALIVVGAVVAVGLIVLTVGYLSDVSATNERLEKVCDRATDPTLTPQAREIASRLCVELERANAGGLAGAIARGVEQVGSAVAGGTWLVVGGAVLVGGLLLMRR